MVSNQGDGADREDSGLNREGFWLPNLIWPAAHPCRYESNYNMGKIQIENGNAAGFLMGCLLVFCSYLIWSDESDIFYQGAFPVH
jgi:hypothetical protein